MLKWIDNKADTIDGYRFEIDIMRPCMKYDNTPDEYAAALLNDRDPIILLECGTYDKCKQRCEALQNTIDNAVLAGCGTYPDIMTAIRNIISMHGRTK